MKFVFYNPNNTVKFNCNLQCQQCEAFTKAGNRCKKRVCIGVPYCYTHLLYNKNLKIKKSNIPNAGNGLFALNPKLENNAIIFKKGQIIANYEGEKLNQNNIDQRYGRYTAPYAIRWKKDNIIDAACKRGIASLANNNRGNINNAELISNRNGAALKAKNNIKNNEEIYASYGSSYRYNEGTSHKTF